MSVMKLFDIKGLGVTADTEKQFVEGGFSFLEALTFEQIVAELQPQAWTPEELALMRQTFAKARIELGIPDTVTNFPKLSVKIAQRSTGREVYFTDFEILDNGTQRVVAFNAYMPIPAPVLRVERHPNSARLLSTSFLDLCYGGATELTSDGSDSPTHVRNDSTYADIGWFMPSRFTDTLIDTLGKVNDALFDGALRECMIYWEI